MFSPCAAQVVTLKITRKSFMSHSQEGWRRCGETCTNMHEHVLVGGLEHFLFSTNIWDNPYH